MIGRYIILILCVFFTDNIVSLFGVVLESSTIMIITELAPLRSLLECLKEPALRSTLTVPCLALFSRQICSGKICLLLLFDIFGNNFLTKFHFHSKEIFESYKLQFKYFKDSIGPIITRTKLTRSFGGEKTEKN